MASVTIDVTVFTQTTKTRNATHFRAVHCADFLTVRLVLDVHVDNCPAQKDHEQHHENNHANIKWFHITPLTLGRKLYLHHEQKLFPVF